MDDVPCSCGGENPRCHRCDGTGMVPQRSAPVLRTGDGFRQAAKRAAGQPTNAFPPQEPRAPKVGGSTLGCRTPGPSLASEPQSTDNSEKLPRDECPHCGVLIRSNWLTRHIAGVHGSVGLGDAPAELTKKKGDMTRCGLCGVLVRKMDRHLRKAHQGSKASMQETSSVKMHAAVSGAGLSSESEPDDLRTEHRSDDSSIGWGQSFRDHGLFGSYPSHDGMDDESKP